MFVTYPNVLINTVGLLIMTGNCRVTVHCVTQISGKQSHAFTVIFLFFRYSIFYHFNSWIVNNVYIFTSNTDRYRFSNFRYEFIVWILECVFELEELNLYFLT